MRTIAVAADVDYLDLGRAQLPALEALRVEIASDADCPGSVLPVAVGTLYLAAPSVAAGPAALWQ